MANGRLALYTVVYPGVEKFLGKWYGSVLEQTDTDFDLWISVDSLSVAEITAALGGIPPARFIPESGVTPARIRHNAITEMVRKYAGIIFVDSDDLLYPPRVETARKALERYDIIGCALRIINEQEDDLGIAFGPAPGQRLEELLPRYNVFGLSNTAYRAEVLRQCLPVPDDCVCIDWLLATRAWAMGVNLHFDEAPQMAYRQHPANTARVLLPFTSSQVLKAATYVLNHYRCALGAGWPLPAECEEAIGDARRRAEIFYRAIAESPATLARYVEALNQLTPQYVWWWCVAHPGLEELWKN